VGAAGRSNGGSWNYSYTFSVPGTYTVYVSVTDANGDMGGAATRVTVWPKMPSPPMP
jgi:hypothetical protein